MTSRYGLLGLHAEAHNDTRGKNIVWGLRFGKGCEMLAASVTKEYCGQSNENSHGARKEAHWPISWRAHCRTLAEQGEASAGGQGQGRALTSPGSKWRTRCQEQDGPGMRGPRTKREWERCEGGKKEERLY